MAQNVVSHKQTDGQWLTVFQNETDLWLTEHMNELQKANLAIDVKTCIQQFSDYMAVSMTGCQMQWWLGGHVTAWWRWGWDDRQKCNDRLYAAVLNSKVESSLWLLVCNVNVSVMLQVHHNSQSSTINNGFIQLHIKSWQLIHKSQIIHTR